MTVQITSEGNIMTTPAPQGQPAQPQNGMGIAALILGVLAIPIGLLLPFIGIIPAVLAIIFGAVGAKKATRGEADNRAVALWGMWLGITATALMAVFVGIMLVVFIMAAASGS